MKAEKIGRNRVDFGRCQVVGKVLLWLLFYLLKSICTQLSIWASVPFPYWLPLAFASPVFRPLNEQFGLNVASSMAIVESKLLHVKRISESWHPHSSTTSAKENKNKNNGKFEVIKHQRNTIKKFINNWISMHENAVDMLDFPCPPNGRENYVLMTSIWPFMKKGHR